MHIARRIVGSDWVTLIRPFAIHWFSCCIPTWIACGPRGQTQVGHPERLDPNQIYGALGSDPEINEPLQPWAGTGPWPTRPWYTPENEQISKTSKHPSVVEPPCYDTLPTFPATVTLETPSLHFNDVPTGETAARAIVFSAVSCHDVHLSITAGPAVLTGPVGTHFGTFPAPLGTAVTIPHIPSSTPPVGRLWISYKGTAPLDGATGTVTVHCDETNQDFVVPIAANTIARPTVAVMLVLDQSGSMDQARWNRPPRRSASMCFIKPPHSLFNSPRTAAG